MATFSGRNSPTALAALAPSINNLAAARNAKSQAAAGLVKTMGVQFEKQREKEARKQKNQAAQQVAEKLLQDPAFRRQAPGITDSAGLVKLVGADNVVKFGLETQQADRVAQESATRINLTKKQIEQYDVDTRKRESDEASGKAFSTAVVGMFGEGYTQEDMVAAIQGMNSSDAASFVGVYNERNPAEMLKQIKIGDRTFVTNIKSGATFDLGTGSQLDKETESRLAAIDQMNISPEEKEKMKQGVLRFSAIPRDEFGDPAPGFGGGAAGVPAGGAGGVPAGGPGGPTGDPPARITLEENSNLQTLFDKMGEDVLENPEKVDGYLFQYRDFLSDEQKETFKKYVIQESIEREKEKRAAALAAKLNPPPGPIDELVMGVPDNRNFLGRFFDQLKQFEDEGTDELLGRNRPSPQINRAENLNSSTVQTQDAPATNQPRTSMLDRASQGPLATSLQRTVKDLSSRIKAYEESGKSFNFNLAKQIAKERAKREAGRNAPEVVKELSKMTIDKINKKPKNESEAKAQSSFKKAIMEVLEMEGPITSYGDPRMKSSVTPVE